MLKNNKKTQSLTSIELQKKIIRGILTIGALTLLIIFLFGNHGLYQLYLLKKERSSIQEKINLLREEKIVLEDEKTKLQTDNKTKEDTKVEDNKTESLKPKSNVEEIENEEATIFQG